jgi:hypothetical protein
VGSVGPSLKVPVCVRVRKQEECVVNSGTFGVRHQHTLTAQDFDSVVSPCHGAAQGLVCPVVPGHHDMDRLSTCT